MKLTKKLEKKVAKWLLLSITAVMVIIFSGFGEETEVALTENAAVKDDNVLSSYDSDIEVLLSEEETAGVPSIQSIRFGEGSTIRRGLVVLGSLFRKNIVPSDKVAGNITITSLYDVSFEEALEAIIGPNKYEESKDGNYIQVFTPEEYQGRLKPYTRELYYITAAEAAQLIAPLLSEYGKVTATTPAVQDTTPGKGGDSLAIRDTIIIKDYKENIAEIRESLDAIDKMPPQILIEVTILEAILDETTEFGIDFDYLGFDGGSLSDVSSSNEGFNVDNLASTIATGGLSVGFIKDNIKGFIRALETVTDTTVLANPKILALNKQAGRLHIGRDDGYLNTTVTNADGAMQQVEFLKSGTSLEFRPYICENNFIRMEISPEQSNGEVVEVGGTSLPNKTLTTVQTNIMVEDGKTIVLGGLFQEKTLISRSQVPVVGDIPIIGELFKSTNDQTVRTELIVLITPHIITKPADADGAERLEDVNRLVYKARKNITWLSRARRAEDRYAEAVRRYRAGDSDGALHQLNWIFEKTRNYLEIERLRDKIITEKFPDNTDQIERIMLGHFEREESAKWYRLLKDPMLNTDAKLRN